ncbi:hypothetical protein ACRFV7_005205 [Klebsiella oxytoca]|uniref:Uncharacterized protein n=6 Tax=Klebsiella/Raoultella group TaxID=2890311 RepID=A0A7H0EW27_KLEVA|nr:MULTISPECIES: hypothetical protein [Enterobacteriaceae]MBS6124232.1 hypothetical protein [Veillonella sp.]AGO89064.1 hypothetical protein pKpNDM1_00172 [Raoultella planticola]ANS55353.1 hypothetical protein [Klebsiella pneumoniae]ASI56962.1 hypothetical protein CA210_01445 [Raoultella ornithinolytica]AUH88293.1 hypothetical protein CYE04_27495 [Klebsiella pneumoniae]
MSSDGVELSSISDGVELSSIWEAGSWFPVREFGILLLVMLFLMIVFGIFRKDFSHLKPLLTLFVLLIALGGTILFMTLFFSAKNKNEAEWRDWAKDHCKIVAKKDGSTTTGVGISLKGQAGLFIGGEPGQTGYSCDDGVTYWKNE